MHLNVTQSRYFRALLVVIIQKLHSSSGRDDGGGGSFWSSRAVDFGGGGRSGRTGGCGSTADDKASDLAARLSAVRPHDALVEAGMVGGGGLDDEAGHVLLHLDANAAGALHQQAALVAELEVLLGAAREADVEADAVPAVHGHLL
jgi:hypothetical protein